MTTSGNTSPGAPTSTLRFASVSTYRWVFAPSSRRIAPGRKSRTSYVSEPTPTRPFAGYHTSTGVPPERYSVTSPTVKMPPPLYTDSSAFGTVVGGPDEDDDDEDDDEDDEPPLLHAAAATASTSARESARGTD